MCIEVQNIRGYYWPEPFKLLRRPEYRLRDWSFLTASPRAFFFPTTTKSRLARVTRAASSLSIPICFVPIQPG